MPHGIVLLATLKNNETAICSSSNFLAATFTQHLSSHPSSGSLLTTSSPLPSPLIVTSHPDQKGLMPLLALLLISIRDAILTTYALLPSHLSVDSRALILIILRSESFYCRNGVLATNIINTASAPHQQLTKGALLLAPSKRTRNIFTTSSYHRSSSPSHDFLSVTKPTPRKTSL